jgi:hypothetical protein
MPAQEGQHDSGGPTLLSEISHNVYYVKYEKVVAEAWARVLLRSWPHSQDAPAMVYNWTFDARRQELRSPAGITITLREIAQRLADRRPCQHDFAGEWSGWKMRRQFLIPPFSAATAPS